MILDMQSQHTKVIQSTWSTSNVENITILIFRDTSTIVQGEGDASCNSILVLSKDHPL